MIYQPRNVKPSGSSVDATKENIFSMEVQTNTSVIAYQLLIFENNYGHWASSKRTLSSPAYNGDVIEMAVPNTAMTNGHNYTWFTRLYQNTADMLITYGSVQKTSTTTNVYIQPNVNVSEGMTLKIGNETRTMTAYNISTGLATVSSAFSSAPSIGTTYNVLSDFILTVPESVVYARANPTIAITNIPTTLTLKYHTFTGNYTQENNVPMSYHIYNLYIKNDYNEYELIDTTGKVYSANLSYTYDGFRSGKSYAIGLTVENDMGIVLTTSLYKFNVSYSIIEYLEEPKTSFDPNQNAINVSWAAPIEHKGFLQNSSTGANLPDSATQYLRNTPYSGVNSLYTNGYNAIWQSDEGICVMPHEGKISFQFCPKENFFLDSETKYNPERTIIEMEMDEDESYTGYSIKLIGQDIQINYGGASYTSSLYTGVVAHFPLTSKGIAQPNEAYFWDDDFVWDDDYIWTEGGTPNERISNHWWRVSFVEGKGIEVREIIPS